MKTPKLYEEDYQSLPWLKRPYWLWLWYSWIFVLWIGKKTGHRYWWNAGRRSDGDPTVCDNCGWVGRVRECVHTYENDGAGDVEPIEECPKCGSNSV